LIGVRRPSLVDGHIDLSTLRQYKHWLLIAQSEHRLKLARCFTENLVCTPNFSRGSYRHFVVIVSDRSVTDHLELRCVVLDSLYEGRTFFPGHHRRLPLKRSDFTRTRNNAWEGSFADDDPRHFSKFRNFGTRPDSMNSPA
jgi:hypothetical protein